MMKTAIIFVITVMFSVNVYAVTIKDLFVALKKQPITKIDEFNAESATVAHNRVVSNFYPKIYGVSSYEHYNTPTNLRPVTPSESSKIMEQNGPLPFSYNIERLGVQMSMPIFIPSLFSLSRKTSIMHKSAKEKAKLNLLKNEAAIICVNANLRYLESLSAALDAKKQSLATMLNHINLGVKNGRVPEIQAIKIMENINKIDLQKQKIKTNIIGAKSMIEDLTSIKLKHSINMHKTKELKETQIYALKPIELFSEAQKYSLEAKKWERSPKIILKSNIFRNFGKGYNNNEHVLRNYGSIGVYLNVPIFDKSISTDTQKAEVDYKKSRLALQKTKRDLEDESYSLNQELKIADSSIDIAEKSVKNQEELLKYAEVSFREERMIEEEYLRYEDALLESKANLFSLEAKRWEIFTKLAVIYGNNLEEMVR